jgi:hypothetical protein
MPRTLNSPLFLFWDFSVRFLDQILSVPYCGTRKPTFGPSRHI